MYLNKWNIVGHKKNARITLKAQNIFQTIPRTGSEKRG